MLAIAPFAHADSLSQADRDMLLEKLEKIQEAADAKTDARFGVAIAAFRNALTSDQAALELYLKCVEKQQVEEQHKKPQEFREWKRRQEAQLGDVGFHHALRFQLRWLLLTMQVASSKKDVSTFGPEAGKILDEIFLDADKLADQRGYLRQSAVGSVFGQTYGLDGLNMKEWPNSPLDTNNIYERLILPSLRNPEKTDALRATWMRRIQQEGIAATTWSKDAGGQERFQQDTYPELMWQMETDVFHAGDQKGAALHMFQHLEKYASHPKASDWAKQFKELLSPRAATAKVKEPATPFGTTAPTPPPVPTPGQ
ncbi:hypothetical protein KBB96_17555 [Luteolibacter ambystomatis]|uniref:Uncharacterized protein n=2 Tax=Luteolibacter ambystomatis TaxID=2824561 RepID=A0A975G7B6_9BACT|nr:hypothetical protein [Luteolibacter ambystomatis]QUE50652.1 hypothetical protein KBB96_17555 [Luteolibacter ambystomatis]